MAANQDQESSVSLARLAQERADVVEHRVQDVHTVVVVLSSRGMTLDMEALRNEISLTYPGTAIFFLTPLGLPVGAAPPRQIDLVIDFTGPNQRQKWLLARGLKSRARVVVGRNAGYFRKSLYDRIFDEKDPKLGLPAEMMERERRVQSEVLRLAGISQVRTGTTPRDRGKEIALELPPYRRL